MSRAYESSHPWITFRLDLQHLKPVAWALLGQAVARCGQVAAAVLPPAAVAEMTSLYLARGVRATTAIEGNTLSEAQVRARLDGQRDLPPSQAYLGQEVDNVLRACADIERAIRAGAPPRLEAGWIADCNHRVLHGLEAHLEEGVVPGEITHAVGVGRYRGAPREDCRHLLDRLCDWLEDERPLSIFASPTENRVATAVLHAVLAHLYIAWIHPFGDGNGRTARLVEFMLLARAGVPFPSVQLLSNHYNRTRAEYYRQLDRASRAGGGRGDPFGFITYALQGFADGLAEQAEYIAGLQLEIAWEHFVHELFRRQRRSPALARRREVALALGGHGGPVAKAAISELTPALARLYAAKTDRTLTRDLHWLCARGLLRRGADGYRARVERLRGGLADWTTAREDETEPA